MLFCIIKLLNFKRTAFVVHCSQTALGLATSSLTKPIWCLKLCKCILYSCSNHIIHTILLSLQYCCGKFAVECCFLEICPCKVKCQNQQWNSMMICKMHIWEQKWYQSMRTLAGEMILNSFLSFVKHTSFTKRRKNSLTSNGTSCHHFTVPGGTHEEFLHLLHFSFFLIGENSWGLLAISLQLHGRGPGFLTNTIQRLIMKTCCQQYPKLSVPKLWNASLLTGKRNHQCLMCLAPT